jgi:hypothetical protein
MNNLAGEGQGGGVHEYPGRCPGLEYAGLTGLKTKIFFIGNFLCFIVTEQIF